MNYKIPFWQNIMDLEEALTKPQAIFKSKTQGLVVLTYMKDVKKKPVMVVVHIEPGQHVNFIPSIYARNNPSTYKKWIKEKLDLFVDKKSDLFPYTQATIAIGGNKSQSKDTKKTISGKNPNEIGLSADMLYGLSMASPEDFGEPGLGKSVSVDDIYDMITKKMVAQIKKATGKGYVKKWKAKAYGKGFLTPINFVSKKPYRGINNLMLKNFDPTLLFENPYFLTFKQIDKLGGKLKKGSKGKEVVYFTHLYVVEYRKKGETKEFGTYSLPKFLNFIKKNRKNLVTQIPESWTAKQIARYNSIPILKYYNVFSGADVEGIDFKLNSDIPGKINGTPLPPKEEIEVAELIIKHYPRPKPEIIHKGDRAFYSYPANKVTVPLQDNFETSQDYYRTLFHELTHCSGDPKHLNRDMGGRFGSKKYAKEELIAEWGATYLSAEAGIMWFTNKNHAEYLKNWNNVLTIAKDDNRFIMRAASAAQKAADYVLDRGNEGEPAYLKDLAKAVEPRKQTVKKEAKKSPGKQLALFGFNGRVQISTNEFEKMTVGELRKYTLCYYNEFLKGKKASIKNHLTEVKFVGKAGRKLLKPMYKEKAAVMEALKSLIENSTYNNFGKPKKTDSPDIIGYLNFKSKLIIDGEKRHVRISISLHRNREAHFKSFDVGAKNKGKTSRAAVANPKDGEVLPLSEDKGTKNKQNNAKKTTKGLKSPVGDIVKQKAVETVNQLADHAVKEATKGIAKVKTTVSKKVRNIAANTTGEATFYNVPGEVGAFLQAVERKPHHSVVITLDGQQGAGKTTFLYKMMNAFAAGGNRGVFMSLEEHPESHLAQEKAAKFIRPKNQQYLDIVGDLDGQKEFFDIVNDYDVIFIDSWQKLQRMIGNIRLDEDLRKKFNGKVFVVIFQQTTTGRTKGGAEIVFDGDIIIKLVKEDKFENNYAYFDKNRYTRKPLETLRYNVAGGYMYDPTKVKEAAPEAETTPPQKTAAVLAVPID